MSTLLESLPQPTNNASSNSATSSLETKQRCHHEEFQSYKYVNYDAFETDWLGNPCRLASLINGNIGILDSTSDNTSKIAADVEENGEVDCAGKDHFFSERYSPGTLVWVLLSKGKQSKKCHTEPTSSSSRLMHKKGRNKKRSESKNCSSSSKPSANVKNQEITLKNGRINSSTPGTVECKNGETQNSNSDTINEHGKNLNANKENEKNDTTESTTYGHHNRSELFLRARVVTDNEVFDDDCINNDFLEKRRERRVLVRYAKGSTYHVRASNLIPVLEPNFQRHTTITSMVSPSEKSTPSSDSTCQNSGAINFVSSSPVARTLPPMVIIAPETHIYRRLAVLHTTPNDTFLEIGCDYGITVDRIRRSLEDGGDVPRVWPTETNVGAPKDNCEESNNMRCLGIDKSRESIDIANERYPKCIFSLADVLIDEEMAAIRAICEQHLPGGFPSVIAIDVNGNREVDGVLQCLQMVMKEKWMQQPRLIIVKSRFLYWDLKDENKNERQ